MCTALNKSTMTKLIGQAMPDQSEKHSIVDDFAYGSNVASSAVYIRLGFLRKVYGIFSVHLLFTTAVCAFFIMCEPVKEFVQHSQALALLVSLLLYFVLIFALKLKRSETPTNFILLTLYTICESFLVGTVVYTFYKVQVVLEAFALTCAVTFALTTYALQSKRDFSSWGAGLFSMLWILILAGFMQFFFPSPMMELGSAIGGAVLLSLFIIYYTHIMMHKVSPEEYIHAVINVHIYPF